MNGCLALVSVEWQLEQPHQVLQMLRSFACVLRPSNESMLNIICGHGDAD
jgi:hypothetical protein